MTLPPMGTFDEVVHRERGRHRDGALDPGHDQPVMMASLGQRAAFMALLKVRRTLIQFMVSPL